MTSASAMISPALRANEGPDYAEFDVRGVRFRVDLVDTPSVLRTRMLGLAEGGYLYEPVMTRCLAQILGEEADPCVLDVGSFLGYYTSFAAAFTGTPERIHAVEANPDFAARTARSCSLSGYPGVPIHNVILSDIEQPARPDSCCGVAYEGQFEGATTAITADTLCAERAIAPNIVKMDVHGCEGKILFGMETVLREHVKYLLLELHDYARLATYSPGISRSRILSFLEGLGFSMFHVAGHAMSPLAARDEGFTYRAVKGGATSDVFYDRCNQFLFLLAVKSPDVVSLLGPSSDDPRFL